jgi:hypothetical protein
MTDLLTKDRNEAGVVGFGAHWKSLTTFKSSQGVGMKVLRSLARSLTEFVFNLFVVNIKVAVVEVARCQVKQLREEDKCEEAEEIFSLRCFFLARNPRCLFSQTCSIADEWVNIKEL